MSDFPLVSVGIPTYNRPTLLRRALKCITTQSYANIEVLVSENYSSELTRSEVSRIICEFSARDHRIFFFPQKKNIGTFNFHFLLGKATGKYFMWASDDDLWGNNYIEACLSRLEKNSEFAGAITLVSSADEFGTPFRCFKDLQLGAKNFLSIYNFCLLHESKGKANPMHSIFKRDVLADIIKYNPLNPFEPFADVNVVAEAMMRGGIDVVPTLSFFKTQEINGNSATYIEPPDSELPRVITKCENFVYIRRLISSGYRNGALLPVCLALFVRSVKEVYNWLYNKGHKIFLCV